MISIFWDCLHVFWWCESRLMYFRSFLFIRREEKCCIHEHPYHRTACLFFVNVKKIWSMHQWSLQKKRTINVYFSHFYSVCLHYFVFAISAFTHFHSTSIVRGHYLTVSTTILFGFSLSYLNDMFPCQSSLARKSLIVSSIVLSLLKPD